MPHLHVIHVLLSGNDSCQLREDARDVFGYRSLRQQLLLSGIFVPQATFVYQTGGCLGSLLFELCANRLLLSLSRGYAVGASTVASARMAHGKRCRKWGREKTSFAEGRALPLHQARRGLA